MKRAEALFGGMSTRGHGQRRGARRRQVPDERMRYQGRRKRWEGTECSDSEAIAYEALRTTLRPLFIREYSLDQENTRFLRNSR